MNTCQAKNCNKPLRNKNSKQKYCVMHLARLKRNGHIGLKTGSHNLEKLPHDIVDDLIKNNIDKTDKQIAEILHNNGFKQATDFNVKYRRKKLGIKKYDGKSAKYFARKKAFQAYGEKCELCEYDLVVDVHHVIEKCKGGGDGVSNLMVLCPNCHSLITRNMLSIKCRSDFDQLKHEYIKLSSNSTSCT